MNKEDQDAIERLVDKAFSISIEYTEKEIKILIKMISSFVVRSGIYFTIIFVWLLVLTFLN
jgi:hypothetical protein